MKGEATLTRQPRVVDCVSFIERGFEYSWKDVADFFSDRNGQVDFDPHVDWSKPRLFGTCSSDPRFMNFEEKPRDMKKWDRALVTDAYWEMLETDRKILPHDSYADLVQQTKIDYMKFGKADFSMFSPEGLTQVRRYISERLKARKKRVSYERQKAERDQDRSYTWQYKEDGKAHRVPYQYKAPAYEPRKVDVDEARKWASTQWKIDVDELKDWAVRQWHMLQEVYRPRFAEITLRFRFHRYAIDLTGESPMIWLLE